MRKFASIFVLVILAIPGIAHAHHGVAAVGIASLEGPGAGLETTSPLTLPQNSLYLMFKEEHVSFQKFQFAEPYNKNTFDFYTLTVGYGITRYLSAYVFQPYSVKTQDSLGTASGFADMNLMLSLGFKYDNGLLLIPEKETLDDLMDWHFSLSMASTIPVGNSARKDKSGNYFSPDMQNSFGSSSLSLSLAAMKQFNDDLTWLIEVSYHYFFEHKYPWIRFQFGGEARLATSIVYRLVTKGNLRLDVIGEASVLSIQRDRSNESGSMKDEHASGGTIFYATAGLRLFYDRLSLGIGIKKAVQHSLSEVNEQQGVEGLENYRLFAVLGFCFGL